jgi:hypothetical protein
MSSCEAHALCEDAPVAHDWPRLRRDADRLLDLQLWMLGRDILHPDGNALLAYGCERVPAPAGRGGTSAYRPPGAGGVLIWWGFGAATLLTGSEADRAAHAAAVFVERHAFGPRLLVAAPVLPLWTPSQLPRARFPRAADDWAAAVAGIVRIADGFGAYERWATDALDRGARRRLMEERMVDRRGRAARRAPEWGVPLPDRWARLTARLGGMA